MQIRQFTSYDYGAVSDWWKAHNFPIIPIEFLPTYGAITLVDDEPVCCAWVYKTDSKLGWLEWLVSNPNYRDKESRDTALNELIEHLSFYAKESGLSALFTSVKVPRLIKRFNSLGFALSDIEMTNMVKVL